MDEFRGMKWDGTALSFLEQTLLPEEEVVIRTVDWKVIVDAIQRLAIRGAPAIGVAAAFATVLAWRETPSRGKWFEAVSNIESARPTAVNLSWAVNKLMKSIEGAETSEFDKILTGEAEKIASDDESMCEDIAKHGMELIKQDSVALTHCNTGILVSYGIGTSFGVLRRAHEAGKLKELYSCEARPLGQGSRLTIWESDKLGIPATLLCDSAAGRLMQSGKVDFVMLGADRIAANGDTANKVGTFNLAVLAKFHNIPFYVAAPSSTFDLNTADGDGIPVEQRDAAEVKTCRGKSVTIENATVFNPAFDVTPSELITAFVREDGIVYPPYEFCS